MKKYFAVALLATLGISSCNLDFKPESELVYQGYWESEEAVRNAHQGMVSQFRNQASNFHAMGELRADLWGGRTIESRDMPALIDNSFSPTSPVFTNWAGYYGTLHYINDFIANAPKPAFLVERDRSNMLAQAHAMRAYIYYTLLKAYGDVILTTEPLTSEQLRDLAALRRPRSPKADVMAQIEKDLAASLDYYDRAGTTTWKNKNTYWSKNATLALKGDVYLWKGQVLGGGQAAFTTAKQALTSVTGALVPYESLWGVPNEYNSEFIFALDYQEEQATNYYNRFTARGVDVSNDFDQAGVALSTYRFNGYSGYGASNYLLNKLYARDDKRGDALILVLTDAGPHDLTQIATSPKLKGVILRKFFGAIGTDGNRKMVNNIPLYRYADVLLLLAEAKNQLGEDPSTEINQVRARAAGASGYTAFVNTGDKVQNKRAILEERMLEFVGEGKRWWDLVRAGDNLVFEYVTNIAQADAYKIYYPISNAMISADPDNIRQTEGW